MTRCQGCDSIQPDVQAYHARFAGVKETQVVLWCGECASLAAADWNGETESVVPVGSPKALA
jgi:hypothetical protein